MKISDITTCCDCNFPVCTVTPYRLPRSPTKSKPVAIGTAPSAPTANQSFKACSRETVAAMGHPTLHVIVRVSLFLACCPDLVLLVLPSPGKPEDLAAERQYHESNIIRFLGDPLPVHEARRPEALIAGNFQLPQQLVHPRHCLCAGEGPGHTWSSGAPAYSNLQAGGQRDAAHYGVLSWRRMGLWQRNLA